MSNQKLSDLTPITGVQSGDLYYVVRAGADNSITGTALITGILSGYIGSASITTLGTIGTGVWQGTAISNSFISSTLSGKRITPRAVTISYAATITPDGDSSDVVNIDTLSGDITINNPSGTPSDGQIIKERMSQDNPGGHVITRGNLWAYTTTVPNSGDSAEPTDANAKWENVWEWSADDSLWYRVGFNQR